MNLLCPMQIILSACTHDIPTARYAGSAHMQDFPLNIITYAANAFRQYMTTFKGINNALLLYYGYNPLLIY